MVGKWREVTLGEIAEIYDGPHATPKKTDDGPIFLGISNISRGRLDLSNTEHVSENDFHRWTRRVEPEEGDVVFSYETRLGEAARVPHGLRCCLGRRMGLLRARGGLVDPRFLLYAYLGPDFQDTLYSRTVHGSTVDRIPLINMPYFPIVIPRNIQEQRRIAHILGTLDDKIENNRKTAKTLEAMAQAIFQSWFVDFDPVRAKMAGEPPERICKRLKLTPEILDLFPDRLVDSELGEIPEGWRVGVLDDYIKSTLGGDWGTDSITSENNVAVQCIRGADIAALNAGGMGKMPTRYIKTASYEKRKIQPGNIVLEISGGSPTQSTGRSTLITEEILQRSNLPLITSNFCRAIQFVGTQQSLYISFLLKHLYVNDEFLQYENGSTGIKNFAFTLFCSEHPIVLPRSAMLAHFEAMVRNFHKRSAVVRAESDIIEDIRDTLLPKLISGEIRVPEAEHLIENIEG